MILFNCKVDVLRLTNVPDGLGGMKESEVVLHQGLPCRINWKKGTEKVLFDKDVWLRDAKLYCKVVDLEVTDRVKYNGKVYEVMDVSDTDNLGKQMTANLKLVE